MSQRENNQQVGPPPSEFGKVLPGWGLEGSIERLRRLADACRELKPARADYLDSWAGVLEALDDGD